MTKTEAGKMLNDMFDAYRHSSDYKDRSMMEIMSNRAEFENNLDNMWAIYSKGNIAQIVEYNKAVQNIKDAGLFVLRNSAGIHKIVTHAK